MHKFSFPMVLVTFFILSFAHASFLGPGDFQTVQTHLSTRELVKVLAVWLESAKGDQCKMEYRIFNTKIYIRITGNKSIGGAFEEEVGLGYGIAFGTPSIFRNIDDWMTPEKFKNIERIEGESIILGSSRKTIAINKSGKDLSISVGQDRKETLRGREVWFPNSFHNCVMTYQTTD